MKDIQSPWSRVGSLKSLLLWPLLAGMLAFTTQASAQSLGANPAQPTFRVLVFSKTLGYRHTSITNGIATLRELGDHNGFAVDATEDAQAFTKANLAHYATVVFLSATGDVLDADQQEALKSYVEGGGGFAGIHGAVFGPSACLDKWWWYGEMFGCAFTNHSSISPGMVMIEDAANPSTAGPPLQWPRTDEWYNFTGSPRGRAHVLATVVAAIHPGGQEREHPMAWCRQVGRGRMWYTAMGHSESSFAEPLFQKHLLGGILVAAGKVPANFSVNDRRTAPWQWQQQAGVLALQQRDQIVWQFNYAATNTKPFFHPVAVPDGPVVTWNAPPDHQWHHALWFSCKYLNQINYWETEAGGEGGRGLTHWTEPQIQLAPDFSAKIGMDITYQPTNGQPVMTEHRDVAISPPDEDDTYHQDWTMTFTAAGQDVVIDRTPLPGEPGGKPWGGYAGLSVRFPKEIKEVQAMTPLGMIGFADGKFRGKATAVDYTGLMEGHEAGIAILDAPGNVNSPSPWYAISDSSMHYFSPAVVQDHPYTLKAGQSFTLRYRVVIHPGRWSSAQLRAATMHYAENQPATPGGAK